MKVEITGDFLPVLTCKLERGEQYEYWKVNR